MRNMIAILRETSHWISIGWGWKQAFKMATAKTPQEKTYIAHKAEGACHFVCVCGRTAPGPEAP